MDETERAQLQQIAIDAQVGHWPPHLGLNTDAERIEFLARNLERVLNVAVWPNDDEDYPA